MRRVVALAVIALMTLLVFLQSGEDSWYLKWLEDSPWRFVIGGFMGLVVVLILLYFAPWNELKQQSDHEDTTSDSQ